MYRIAPFLEIIRSNHKILPDVSLKLYLNTRFEVAFHFIFKSLINFVTIFLYYIHPRSNLIISKRRVLRRTFTTLCTIL